jgi:hypothetical protein
MRFLISKCVFTVALFALLRPVVGFSSPLEGAASPGAEAARSVEEKVSPVATAEDETALPEAPTAPAASVPAKISGTVEDTNGDLVPGATVVLRGPSPATTRTAQADGEGMFTFDNVDSRFPYHLEIHLKGFVDWAGPQINLQPGQVFFQSDIHIRLQGDATSVTVYGSQEQIATEQVEILVQQRVFGIVPNFYVSYDPNPVPLSAKLKFKLAARVAFDPATIGASAFMAGIYQGMRFPDYQLGTVGYFERFGSGFADETTDILFGGAILPALLHQDPRYFYQGTGTTASRIRHAISNPFLCRGDNGKREINYSTMGGDLASSLISTTYYPASSRNGSVVAENMLISTGERMASSLVQEFVLGKFTSRGKSKD